MPLKAGLSSVMKNNILKSIPSNQLHQDLHCQIRRQEVSTGTKTSRSKSEEQVTDCVSELDYLYH